MRGMMHRESGVVCFVCWLWKRRGGGREVLLVVSFFFLLFEGKLAIMQVVREIGFCL